MSEKARGWAPHITFRMRPEDQALLRALDQRLGIGQTAVFRLALRRLAAAEGINIEAVLEEEEKPRRERTTPRLSTRSVGTPDGCSLIIAP